MPLRVGNVVLVYVILFALAIPWYLPEQLVLFMGLPIWVAVSLFFSLCISLFTAWILLTMTWPDE